jgi:hypothetical protein
MESSDKKTKRSKSDKDKKHKHKSSHKSDKDKKHKDKHGSKHKSKSSSSSREKKVKAETFSVGVYTALPVDSLLLTKKDNVRGFVAPIHHLVFAYVRFIRRQTQKIDSTAAKEDKVDCACGVPEHPKVGSYNLYISKDMSSG